MPGLLTWDNRPVIFALVLGLAAGLGNIASFATSPACADAVRLGDSKVIFGQILEERESEIVFNRFLAAGRYRREKIPLGDVKQVITTIDRGRLEQLSPDDPVQYRNYAEELASYSEDPAAIDLARRLYLLAAYWGSDRLRESSFRGLIALAESPSQEKRLRVLAFKLAPHQKARWLEDPLAQSTENQSQPLESTAPRANVDLAEARRDREEDRSQSRSQSDEPVTGQGHHAGEAITGIARLVRQHEFDRARSELDTLREELELDPGAARQDSKHVGLQKWIERLDGWIEKGALTNFELRQVVRLEHRWLAAKEGTMPSRGGAGSGELSGDTPRSWNGQIRQAVPEFKRCDFETVTPFHPKRAWFRRGEWIRLGAEEESTPNID